MHALQDNGHSWKGVKVLMYTFAALHLLVSSEDVSPVCSTVLHTGTAVGAHCREVRHNPVSNAASTDDDDEIDIVTYIQGNLRLSLETGTSALEASSSPNNEQLFEHALPAAGARPQDASVSTLAVILAWRDSMAERLQSFPRILGSPESEKLVPSQQPGLDRWDAWDVILLLGTMVVFIGFDWQFLLDKNLQTLKTRVTAFAFTILISCLYLVLVRAMRGRADSIAWAAGYVMEWALSMDNLFMYLVILKAFAVPHSQSHFAIVLGFYGSVILRVPFVLGLSACLELHPLLIVLVGTFLIASGLFALRDDDDELDVQSLRTVKICKWCLGPRLLDSYDMTGRAIVYDEKGFHVTPLFLVVCVIMVVDVVFAVDSVGSKTGHIKSRYINLSSSLVAMFCLRALFFIISDMADYFELLKYGICMILVFLGLDMILGSLYKFDLGLGVTCILVFGIFVVSVLASIVAKGVEPNELSPPESSSDYEESLDEGTTHQRKVIGN